MKGLESRSRGHGNQIKKERGRQVIGSQTFEVLGFGRIRGV